MAARRRVFVVLWLEKEDDRAICVGVASSLPKAKQMAVDVYNEWNITYPMVTHPPTEWINNRSGDWYIDSYWLDEVARGEQK